MKINIPEFCLVVLIGPSGSGKSSFGRKHFKPTEVISSDFCRGLVSDDENNQACTGDAFDVLNFIVAKRLAARKLTVIDATNVNAEDRKGLVKLARDYHCLPVAIVFDLPEKLCHDRNKNRPDRDFGEHVVRKQHAAMRKSLRGLEREGFRYIFKLPSEEAVNEVETERTRLWTDKKDDKGPFDIIGDIHGCYDELIELLQQLGYDLNAADDSSVPPVSHPEGRRAVFVGDLVDRGPKNPEVLKLVMKMVSDGTAICVPGNHDVKLMKKLKGRNVQITHGLKESLEQLEKESDDFKKEVVVFLDKLISHYVFDDGKLVVAHAGLKEDLQGRSSARVRDFALFGETTGETDEYGLPVRYNWAQDYRGEAMVVYGHTPVPEPEWINRTICIDTGCVFGGSLTALRYPERELVSVKAAHTYYEPAKPFAPVGGQSAALDRTDSGESAVLDIEDVLGRRVISTQFQRNITIREQNAIAALEVMSRFAVNPKWLIYLPPTMSPCETSKLDNLLEHPQEAFRYYLNSGVPRVVCEEKHMGSRAVVIVCRNEAVAKKRFGVEGEGRGICYTRTGRRFFTDLKTEQEFIDRVCEAISSVGLWDEFETDWFAFDCELMPWSAKAQELLKDQYAAVGVAGAVSLNAAVQTLGVAAARDERIAPLLDKYKQRLDMVEQYRQAYRRYCWTVNSLDDIKLAPFHILACESKTYFDRDHKWHMETIARIAEADPGFIVATPFKIINLTQENEFAEGVSWWEELTAKGGEGMVVKSFEFVAKTSRGVVQPAVKCRGPEYLRIIYGPEYTTEEHLVRLRSRGLSAKRSLAIREFALGIEAMERFVRKEPLYRVHECVFGVLALESEPVDPRL